MSQNICNICGANYAYKDGKWVCPACGAYKPEELSNEEVTLLYNAAQTLRLNAFDDAEEMYRDIVRKYPKCSEGYWGLVLAKYGIKYEQDYDGKMIPTCYAASYDSILTDKDYQRALDLASKDNRKYYEAQAERIEKIRKEWVEKAQKEPPYDIFISYKDTELENGVNRTNDSYDAFELYTHLRSLGYNVFFSRESLKGKEGEKYEPYIFNALNTAHVMIVFGSKPEYIESTWIKNEWSRFYKRIKNGQKQSNALIVVQKDFNPSQLPRPLNTVQSLDRNALTFISDLDAYVSRVVGAAKMTIPHIERVEIKAGEKGGKSSKNKNRKKSDEIRPQVEKREIGGMQTQALTANAEKRLAVAYAYLQGEQYDEAERAFSDFLLSDKNNGKALIGKLLSDVHCKSVDCITCDSLSDFVDWDLLDRVLHCAEKSDAEKILEAFCVLSAACLTTDTGRAKAVCEQVCAYDLPCVAQLREELFAFGLQNSAAGEAKYFIDVAILYEQNSAEYIKKLKSAISSCAENGQYAYADEYAKKLADSDETAYTECCVSVADAARKARKFGVAKEYYEKALEYDQENTAALFGRICSAISCESDDRLYEHIQNLNDFSEVEGWLAALSETEYISQLELLLAACEKHIAERGTDKDNIGDVAQRLLAYIPKNNDDKLVVWLKRLADAFKENGDFATAQRFYAMAIAADGEDHATYWGLLQSKLNCKTDEEVIEQSVPLADFQEFQNALIAADSNRDAMAHYIDVQGKQKERAAEKARKNKAAKKRKKVAVITSIVLTVILIICGAIGGGVWYYKSENQLQFTAVNGGYAVKAGKYYHKNSSGKFVIPDEYNGKPVVEIADGAFENFNRVTEFVIPETVTKIGERAFANTAITEITISPDMQYVGANAFDGCNALRVIHIPERNELPVNWSADWQIGTAAKVEFQLKVIYDYDGATSGNTQKTVYVVHGEKFAFAVPSRDGYAFDGWYRGEVMLTDVGGRSVSEWAYNDGGTVQAHWTANENRVVFDANGGSGSMPEQKIKTDETGALAANTFARKGYAFSGWATSETGSKAYADKAKYVMGVKPVYTLYAVWTPNENSIEFDANGGSGNMPDQIIKTDGTAKLDANKYTKHGYTFAGWSTSLNGSKAYSDCANYIMGTNSSYTLYALWTPTEYTITYTLGGGTVEGNPTTYTIVSDTFTLANPTRVGYKFTGWTGTDISVATQTVTVNNGSIGNRSYTANWSPNINTVTFLANGGEGSMTSQKIATDASANLNANAFYRDGYEFVGWATSATGSKAYDNNARYDMGADANYDLYAVWNIANYAITYKLNGGTAGGNPTQYNIESETFTLINPIRAGYTFAGWTGTDIDIAQTSVTVDKGSVGARSYIANWTANINTIVFHANGGEGDMQDQKIATDETDTLSQNKFTRRGYTFTGWSTVANGAKVYNDIASYTMGTATQYNLYAVWQIDTYSINYKLNGGSATGNLSVYNVNTADFTLRNPTRRGYEFIGWSGTDIMDKADTVTVLRGSVGDREYTANYRIIDYTISYTLNGGAVSDNITAYTVEHDTFTLNNPIRKGYSFIGWSGTDITGTTTSLVIEKGSIGNREYEAIFEAKQYTVTFKPNGGKCDVDRITVRYDEELILPEVKRFAYDFLGWYNGEILFENGVWNYESNYTLTAQWQKQEIIELRTAEDLSQVVYELSSNYILQADIDLQNAEWNIIGDKSNPFTGTFDGNHHTVSNFTISNSADYVGFFGANSGTVKNLRLTGANITSGTLGVGILVGYNTGRIEECNINGQIVSNAQSIGGIVGVAESQTSLLNIVSQIKIENCSTKYDSVGLYIGGVIGRVNQTDNNLVQLNRCSAKGLLIAEGKTTANGSQTTVRVGGIVGYGDNIHIENSFFDGSIRCIAHSYGNYCDNYGGKSPASSRAYVGGILGQGKSNITVANSYTVMDVDINVIGNTGDKNLGTTYIFAGAELYYGSIMGGIVVSNITGQITNCFGYTRTKRIDFAVNDKTVHSTIADNRGGVCSETGDAIQITNCYRDSNETCNVESGTATTITNFRSPNFIKNTLGWDDLIWILENGEYPKLNLYNFDNNTEFIENVL